MKRYLTIGIALAAAAAALATVYLEQDFEGVWPPGGWYYYILGGGPGGGNWARVSSPNNFGIYIYSTSLNGGTITTGCRSNQFTLPSNTTLYYRFDCSRWNAGSANGGRAGGFQLVYDGILAFGFRSIDPTEGWRVLTGSFISTFPAVHYYQCEWFTGTTINGSTPGTAALAWDNVLVSDQPFTAIAPASLGRVKALYR